MADKQHNALTGAALHEPKGVAAASVDTIYAADGAGSGTHRKVTHASMDKTSVKNVNLIYLTHKLLDISSAKSDWIVCPLAGKVTKIWSVISGAITVANSGFTFEIAGIGMTNGVITVAFVGSAAGTIDSSTPTAANVLTAGQPIEMVANGNSTGAVDITFTFEIDIT